MYTTGPENHTSMSHIKYQIVFPKTVMIVDNQQDLFRHLKKRMSNLWIYPLYLNIDFAIFLLRYQQFAKVLLRRAPDDSKFLLVFVRLSNDI